MPRGWWLRWARPLAWLWRRLLYRTKYIAITGEMGKTVARECLAAILDWEDSAAQAVDGAGQPREVVTALLHASPWHRYVLIECSTNWRLGDEKLLRPDIVLAIGGRGPLGPAGDRALFEAVGPGGVVCLYADDIYSARLAESVGHRAFLFGVDPQCHLVAEEVQAAFPKRLGFTARTAGTQQSVETRLVGIHQLPAALGGLAAALCCGVTIENAARRLAQHRPSAGRMQPVLLLGRKTVLRDDVSGSPRGFRGSLTVLRDSRANRKVVVLGEPDSLTTASPALLRKLGRAAATAADAVIFVGPGAGYGTEGALDAGVAGENVHSFLTCEAAAKGIGELLKPGDLILLKGSRSDHLARIFFSLIGKVACWKATCAKVSLCDHCSELGDAGERARFIRPGFGIGGDARF